MANRHSNRGEGSLDVEQQRKLLNHIRALETLEDAMQEVRDDIKFRKEIVKADGFDNNIVAMILKRRKVGKGESMAADNLLQLYEDALEEQGIIPLEERKREGSDEAALRAQVERLQARLERMEKGEEEPHEDD